MKNSRGWAIEKLHKLVSLLGFNKANVRTEVRSLGSSPDSPCPTLSYVTLNEFILTSVSSSIKWA